ncbi:hypothetical protein [Metabacillus sp. B2-18]|uniref:hypothetical protein n=1 Tax=Metabacillus sp. B2-18 TaxID=2897333 RepID=UPI001E2A4BF2|nr:hypothetical protein [Metabacillus sp. B2-18]UGB29839.1 hypothetical protein LPC09_19150 [Metabacillus sp. B2-18]
MRKYSFFMLVIILVLLSGCTQSEESLRNDSIDHTKQAFDNEELEVNEETEQFSFYLPNDFKIKEKNDYNVLLEDGNKSYILFVNLKEPKSSKVSYKTLTEQYQEPFISKTFEQKGRFGYLFVVKIAENKYEVTVGVGGTKVTTEVKGNDVVEDAEAMMMIANSVQ